MVDDNNMKYQAAAAANVVVATGKAILHRIIFGADVSSSVVEISDSLSDGDGNVKIYIAGDTLATSIGSLEVGAVFPNGICADLTNQTQVTFVWSPIA